MTFLFLILDKSGKLFLSILKSKLRTLKKILWIFFSNYDWKIDSLQKICKKKVENIQKLEFACILKFNVLKKIILKKLSQKIWLE